MSTRRRSTPPPTTTRTASWNTLVFTLIFVISSMSAMGTSLTVSQISESFRDVRLVLLAVLANFVLMPLAAFTIANVLWLDEAFAVGLLVLGCSAGAPFLPKLAKLAKGNVPSAVGIMVLLMVITVLYLPIVLPMPLPGVTVWTHGGSHARSSCSCFFPSRLDSFSTLGTRAWPTGSNPWPASYPILALVAMIELIVITNFDKILDVFGTRAILAGLVFISSGFGNSWLLGGSNTGIGRVLALGTAQPNIAAALVVASQNLDDPKVAVIVIVVSIVGLLLLLPLARALAKR